MGMSLGERREVEEETYNIESLVKKAGSKYLVRWENYSEEYNTWEPRKSIPKFILKVNTGFGEILFIKCFLN